MCRRDPATPGFFTKKRTVFSPIATHTVGDVTVVPPGTERLFLSVLALTLNVSFPETTVALPGVHEVVPDSNPPLGMRKYGLVSPHAANGVVTALGPQLGRICATVPSTPAWATPEKPAVAQPMIVSEAHTARTRPRRRGRRERVTVAMGTNSWSR